MVFKPEENCWRTSRISHGTLLVDCANFYRALHSAITKAKRSIFIVGWDIDSRIRLLRGEDEKAATAPSRALDLIAWKAKQNPEIDIYLLRWDASISFMDQRELQAQHVWEANTPENVHVWLDSTIPVSGSHHQKVIVIDDETVFTGGMDIAPQRWDERAHTINDPERYDDAGSYDPYHDIQIVVDGPVVKDFADLARWRWKHAAGYEALPVYATGAPLEDCPPSWPDGQEIWFHDMECAIARTLPWMGKHKEVFEVKQMYLDMIAVAEKFIYIENQFYAYEEIAHALNERLKACPALRVMLLGPYNPQGFFECEAMWAPRIDFKRILEDGVDPSRVKMLYPVIYGVDGKKYYKRIHSKICAIDDRYFRVASSNLSQRSMTMDTECDLILKADTEQQRAEIRRARNDLLAEHTSRSIEEVDQLIEQGKTLYPLIATKEETGCRLQEMDDSIFTDQKMQTVARALADPEEPLLRPLFFTSRKPRPMHNPRKHILLMVIAALILAAAAIGLISQRTEWLDPARISEFLEMARGTIWAVPLVTLVYVLGGLIMFPVTVLSLMITAVFGAVLGPIYAMWGALISAALLYWIGHIAGIKGIRHFLGERIRSLVTKVNTNGILGMVIIRLTPIAPYTLVNLAAGIVGIRFRDYMIGTFFGLAPGLLAKGFVGDSMMQVFLDPTSETFAYLVAGIIFWLILVLASQKLVKYLVARQKNQGETQTA